MDCSLAYPSLITRQTYRVPELAVRVSRFPQGIWVEGKVYGSRALAIVKVLEKNKLLVYKDSSYSITSSSKAGSSLSN